MKTTKKAQKFIIPTLILILALGVYLSKQQVTTTDIDNGLGNPCTFVNLTCEIGHEQNKVSATFESIPEAEESITVNFSLPFSQQIESVWIEGVNMYMGKIPVLLDNDGEGKWSGWFMLGSCSEPVMKWQLRLNIKDKESPSYLYFVTQQ